MNDFSNNMKDKPLTIGDPRLTALALGEIKDDALMAEIENDPAMKAEFERIRSEADDLRAAYKEEAKKPAPVKIAKTATADKKTLKFILLRPRVYIPMAGAIAAGFVMAAMIPHFGKIAARQGATAPEVAAVGNIGSRTATEVTLVDSKPEEEAALEVKLDAAAKSMTMSKEKEPEPYPLATLSLVEKQNAPIPSGAACRNVEPSAFSIGYANTSKDIVAQLSNKNGFSRESYDHIEENAFVSPTVEPLSTFSIDVDTASYSNVRRMLNEGSLPPAGAVRIEEMINYFDYDYAPPKDRTTPFAAHIEATNAPWATDHEIVRIGLKGYEIPWSERPASNLVFLVDVSGSMNEPDKLPLVKQGLKMLVGLLDGRDSVAIVTYAGCESLALPSTTANNRETIAFAIDRLGAGGSTNGAGGIKLAYEQAKAHFIKDGVNRVILCTDGDFNVGVTSRSELVDMIKDEAKSGVFLTVCGFGTGNFRDAEMQDLADKGNGNYAYIDSEAEARRVFMKNASGNMITIAKDVKIQVEFNPKFVQAYRLIGYENRKMAAQDFNDDKKDAGEIGAGHCVTALYEIVPVGAKWEGASVDALKYQSAEAKSARSDSGEILTVKIRYKLPAGDTSTKQEFTLASDSVKKWADASADTRWASSVALFGMMLDKSKNAGSGTYDMVRDLAGHAIGNSRDDAKAEFLGLVDKAASISKATEKAVSFDISEPINGGKS